MAGGSSMCIASEQQWNRATKADDDDDDGATLQTCNPPVAQVSAKLALQQLSEAAQQILI